MGVSTSVGPISGIDYGKLVETLLTGAAHAVICLGESGARIYALARAADPEVTPAHRKMPFNFRPRPEKNPWIARRICCFTFPW